ncbi:MAG: hypothetical protein FWC61_01820 [Proteobacteria bacterium]|nr:hypothetical protein [Pseudomonadota bacterium]
MKNETSESTVQIKEFKYSDNYIIEIEVAITLHVNKEPPIECPVIYPYPGAPIWPLWKKQSEIVAKNSFIKRRLVRDYGLLAVA